MKALVDRAGVVSLANDGLFKRKVGSAVVAQRRLGAIHSLDTLLHFLLIADMIVPGWPVIGVGRDIGDVDKDDEGIGAGKECREKYGVASEGCDKMIDICSFEDQDNGFS